MEIMCTDARIYFIVWFFLHSHIDPHYFLFLFLSSLHHNINSFILLYAFPILEIFLFNLFCLDYNLSSFHTYPKYLTLQQTFMLTYMVVTVIEWLFLHKINAAISTRYLVLKFSILKEVAMVRGNQEASRQCVSTCFKDKKKSLILEQQGSLKKRLEIRTKAMEMLKAISLKEEWEIVTKTCSILDPDQ